MNYFLKELSQSNSCCSKGLFKIIKKYVYSPRKVRKKSVSTNKILKILEQNKGHKEKPSFLVFGKITKGYFIESSLTSFEGNFILYYFDISSSAKKILEKMGISSINLNYFPSDVKIKPLSIIK